MKKIIFFGIRTIILFLLLYNHSLSADTTFVAPSELEDGWGLYCINPGDYICDLISPKSVIIFLQVSPDGNWLFFEDDHGFFKLLNLKTKEISLIDCIVNALWLPNSSEFSYSHPTGENSGLIFYNLNNHNRDTIRCPDSKPNCSFGGFFGMDGNMYFPLREALSLTDVEHNFELYKDTNLYRTNTVLSRETGFAYNEIIGKKYTIFYWPPIFPPNTIHYYINKFPRDGIETEGFDITTDFNYQNHREIRLNPPDTNWVFSGCNSYGGSLSFTLKQIEAGPRGDVYCYLSFRSKKDVSKNCMPAYWDSSTIAVRNASGWYRVDTSGNNLVQLVRSWTYGMGGISITADGETIYYGMLDKDSNAAIYKMNRFGKNKELVLNLGNMSGFTCVNESVGKDNSYLKSIVVDDASEITIKFGRFIGKPAIITIYDIWGREIMKASYQLINNGIKVNVSELPQGFYIISCSDNISVDFYKFLKN